jgi:hypothetical protein
MSKFRQVSSEIPNGSEGSISAYKNREGYARSAAWEFIILKLSPTSKALTGQSRQTGMECPQLGFSISAALGLTQIDCEQRPLVDMDPSLPFGIPEKGLADLSIAHQLSKKKPANFGWSSLIQNGFYLGAAAKPSGPAVVEILVGGWRRVLLTSATAGSPADLRIRDGT